tara:strand:- start:144 stop:2057 length:1914 start_codon:yes stop_codon:yes gene_type:complete
MEEKKQIKILIVSQYFWPENFRVNDIATYFKEKGAHVEILTGKPNYPGGNIYKDFKNNPSKYLDFNGCKVFRVPMYPRKNGSNTNLFFNYLSFLLSSIFFGILNYRKKKFDYIFTFGTSPLTVALTSIILSKICRSKNCLWVLDLWPEIIFELGVLKGKFLEKILSKLIIYIFNKTDIILAQSESYVELIKQKIINKDKVYYFPSWPEIIQKQSSDLNKIEIKDKDKLKIFFTGSIGDAQNFRVVIDIISKTSNLNIKWFIIGGGRRFKELIKLRNINKLENLELIDFLEPSKIVQYQQIADVLFLSLKNGKVLSSTIPGKFSTYLKYKKPILGLISGEVNSLINKYEVGFAVSPDNEDEFLNKIKKLIEYKSNGTLNNKFKNFDKLLNKFDFDKNLNFFEKLLFDNLHILDNKFETIKLVTKLNYNFYKKNFILSGLNLSFLGHYVSKETNIFKNLYHWPDGLFKFIFFKKKTKKIPGRDLIKNLEIPSFIKKIYVLGDLPDLNKKYLVNKFNKELIHINLPFGTISEILKEVPIIEKDSICLLTLPTPKQEQVARYISEKQDTYKIFCIGGAINMITGLEAACPKFLENYGLETIWRLKTDTKRRTFRLLKTLSLTLYGLLVGKFKKLKGEMLEN